MAAQPLRYKPRLRLPRPKVYSNPQPHPNPPAATTFLRPRQKKKQYTYVDDDSNRLLTVDFGEGTDEDGFWEKGHFEERFPGVQNPWSGASRSAPYDQKFYVVMNVAVGGVSGFFPDDVVSVPGGRRGRVVYLVKGGFVWARRGGGGERSIMYWLLGALVNLTKYGCRPPRIPTKALRGTYGAPPRLQGFPSDRARGGGVSSLRSLFRRVQPQNVCCFPAPHLRCRAARCGPTAIRMLP